MRYIIVALFLIVFPFIWGLPWVSLLPSNGNSWILACLPVGFFVEMGLFQLIAFPFAIFRWKFSALCVLFLALLCLGCIASLLVIRRHPIMICRLCDFSAWESVLLVVFLVLLGLQLFCAYYFDTTYMSYDDAAYVSYAADALQYDYIQLIDPYTGLSNILNIQRAMQSFSYYPGVLSFFSKIPVTVLCRTVLEIFDIILAYLVYAYSSSVIFQKRDSKLIFLILLSVLYIFGYYSHYSKSFRLLGPNYQGKAIVATSLFPLILTIFVQKLTKQFDAKVGMLLFLYSAASTGFSMFGSVTLILTSCIAVLIAVLIKRNNCNCIKYIPYICTLPTFHCALFFVYKYFVW